MTEQELSARTGARIGELMKLGFELRKDNIFYLRGVAYTDLNLTKHATDHQFEELITVLNPITEK